MTDSTISLIEWVRLKGAVGIGVGDGNVGPERDSELERRSVFSSMTWTLESIIEKMGAGLTLLWVEAKLERREFLKGATPKR